MSDIQIIPYGESHLLLKLEQAIAPAINKTIHALGVFIAERFRGFVLSCTPAYCSLLIAYDSSKVNAKALTAMIHKTIDTAPVESSAYKANHFRLPVCYDSSFGVDLQSLSDRLSISVSEIISIHSSQRYLLYMKGFLPGFLYLGETDERIAIDRHDVPRKKVPQGSVGLAGRQTGIYPCDAPGGWQIIGTCPIPLIQWDSAKLSIFSAGDTISFDPIDLKIYDDISTQIRMGVFDYESLIE